MARLTARSVLIEGAAYHYNLTLAYAPTEAVRAGQPVSAQDLWGTHTASRGQTVAQAQDAIFQFECQRLGVNQRLTTLVRFSLAD